MKKILILSSIASALLLPGAGFAQTTPAPAAEPSPITGNVTLVSDYRFRGISQTYKKPAIQGGFDFAHASGLYVGTWLSNVSGNLYPNGAALEWDMYAGYKFEPVKDLTLDIGLLHYDYPGAYYNVSTKDKFDNTEIYLGATYKWFSAKYSRSITDYFGAKTATYGGYCGIGSNGVALASDCIGANPGGSKGSSYLDLNANFEIAEKTTLGLHVGHTNVKNYSQLSYTDYKLSLTKDFGWVTLGAAYVTTNAKQQFYRYGPATIGATAGGVASTENKDPARGTLVLSLSKTF